MFFQVFTLPFSCHIGSQKHTRVGHASVHNNFIKNFYLCILPALPKFSRILFSLTLFLFFNSTLFSFLYPQAINVLRIFFVSYISIIFPFFNCQMPYISRVSGRRAIITNKYMSEFCRRNLVRVWETSENIKFKLQ